MGGIHEVPRSAGQLEGDACGGRKVPPGPVLWSLVTVAPVTWQTASHCSNSSVTQKF